jgi:HEAT repeat protein
LAVLPLQLVVRDWLNYRKRGIGPEDVGELIRIATDPAQFEAEWDDEVMTAARHAMRALAQMKTKEAIAPLLQFIGLCFDEDCDWLADDLRVVLGRFGPVALPELKAYLSNVSANTGLRAVVADAISELGDHDPSQRADCVAILARQLEHTFEKEQDIEMNSILVDCLLSLEATESAPLIERVYQSGKIDEEIAGDLEDAQVAIGLKEEEDEDEDEGEDDGDWVDDPGPDWQCQQQTGWIQPAAPSWSDPGAYQGKTPKERALERAKARKKHNRKKK